MELGSLARACGVRLLALESVDSTNDEARRLIDAGERGPLWGVAARQTRGHGRLGREWISPAGNLHASFILSDFGEQAVAPQLGFVAGVAVLRALRAATGEVGRFMLKWPNDLLLDGAKLGGILLQNVGVPTGDAREPRASIAIIGVGVNCAEAPSGLPFEARALTSIGPNTPDAATLFTHLSDALVETLDLWRCGEGFARIREAWLKDAAYLGAHIRVELPRETVAGRFETIDTTGRLVLAMRDGERVIEAGDVSLGPRQAAAGGVA